MEFRNHFNKRGDNQKPNSVGKQFNTNQTNKNHEKTITLFRFINDELLFIHFHFLCMYCINIIERTSNLLSGRLGNAHSKRSSSFLFVEHQRNNTNNYCQYFGFLYSYHNRWWWLYGYFPTAGCYSTSFASHTHFSKWTNNALPRRKRNIDF